MQFESHEYYCKPNTNSNCLKARGGLEKLGFMNYNELLLSNTYRIFAIKRPRRLFKTWPQGPGVYLKPVFNRGPAFINEVKFSSLLG